MMTEEMRHRLEVLQDAFLRENAKFNLSAFRTREACWTGNILDSLAALEVGVLRDCSPTPCPSPDGGGDVSAEYDWHPKRNPSIHGGVLSHAREMRKAPTKAEELLWEALRFNQLYTRFRRQHPIGGMILDFYCHDAKLGIEVDGSTHDTEIQQEHDEDRTDKLYEDYGIRVIRFTNEQVLHHLSFVLSSIQHHLHFLPPPGEGSGMGEITQTEIKRTTKKILDLGTGGGFPLLPLALNLPQCRFVGVDSVQKKIAAVQRIIDELSIPNVTLLCGRAEELGRDSLHREQYDVVLCRAVDALNVLLELAASFAKAGGFILCWKSLNIEQELKDSLLARAELSCQLQRSYVYDLGADWGKRQILVFTKRAKTKEKYPRGIGIPKKSPLV